MDVVVFEEKPQLRVIGLSRLNNLVVEGHRARPRDFGAENHGSAISWFSSNEAMESVVELIESQQPSKIIEVAVQIRLIGLIMAQFRHAHRVRPLHVPNLRSPRTAESPTSRVVRRIEPNLISTFNRIVDAFAPWANISQNKRARPRKI